MEVYPTQHGDVVRVVIPPTVYETVEALGYHQLGDLYTEDHRIKRERTRKERALARKVLPAVGHGWPTIAPSWRPYCGCPRHGGRLHLRSRSGALCPHTRRTWSLEACWPRPAGFETIYHGGYPIKVTTAMKDAMEAKDWVQELRVCW